MLLASEYQYGEFWAAKLSRRGFRPLYDDSSKSILPWSLGWKRPQITPRPWIVFRHWILTFIGADRLAERLGKPGKGSETGLGRAHWGSSLDCVDLTLMFHLSGS